MLFNTGHLLVHMRQYYWLNGEILQNEYFQYFDRSKTRHDRAKIGLAVQHDRPRFKNYFEPCHGYYMNVVKEHYLSTEGAVASDHLSGKNSSCRDLHIYFVLA